MAYLDVIDKVPSWEEIVKSPKKTAIPKSPAAQLLLVFGSVSRVKEKNAQQFTDYFFRFDVELRMLWARQFKQRLASVMGVQQFRDVLIKDCWVFN